jgi:hypothetical protein
MILKKWVEEVRIKVVMKWEVVALKVAAVRKKWEAAAVWRTREEEAVWSK